MAREVTYELVASIADTMAARGEKPEVRAIRADIGFGSFATIQKHLDRWRASKSKDGNEGVLPPGIARAIFKYVGEETKRIHDELQEDLDDAREAKRRVIEESEALATELENLHAQVRSLESANATLEGKITQLEKNLASERREVDHARSLLSDARFRLGLLEPAQDELRDVRQELERERKAHFQTKLRAAAARSGAHLDEQGEQSLEESQTSQGAGADLTRAGKSDGKQPGSRGRTKPRASAAGASSAPPDSRNSAGPAAQAEPPGLLQADLMDTGREMLPLSGAAHHDAAPALSLPDGAPVESDHPASKQATQPGSDSDG